MARGMANRGPAYQAQRLEFKPQYLYVLLPRSCVLFQVVAPSYLALKYESDGIFCRVV
jgi:hypothetical protein